MNNQTKPNLSKLVKVKDLPLNIGRIHYQPTTGYFFQDNGEIQIESVVVTGVGNVTRRLIVEQDKKVVFTKVVQDELYSNDELLYVQDTLSQEGYKAYETNSFAFAGYVKYKDIKRTKKEAIIGDDLNEQLAVIYINSGTHMPGIAFSSLIKLFEGNLKDEQSIVEIEIQPNVTDEPFTTRNTGREIYQLTFLAGKKTEVKALQKITSHKNGEMIANIVNNKLLQKAQPMKSLGETFKSLSIDNEAFDQIESSENKQDS